jgi:hypothetical protein
MENPPEDIWTYQLTSSMQNQIQLRALSYVQITHLSTYIQIGRLKWVGHIVRI